ncbi:MAG: LamG domain-containing protein, partial [Candidatus Berkelbacteria bacterium]|nr:LamG domain-containing protein [Candidatus Berkelbacteria bacterium]
GNDGWRIEVTSNNVIFGGYINGASSFLITSKALSPNKWSHVVVTYNGGIANNSAIVYLNGTADPNGFMVAPTVANRLNNSSANITLGVSAGGNDGVLDDLRIYDAVLTSEAVSNMYNGYGPVANIKQNRFSSFARNYFLPSSNAFGGGPAYTFAAKNGQYANNGEPNIVGGWRFDEGSGTTANDLIGESSPLAAGTANNITGINPANWTTGMVGLGLTLIPTVIDVKVFLVYGPQ